MNAAERQAVNASSLVAGVVEKTLDRESAHEIISARIAGAASTAAPAAPANASPEDAEDAGGAGGGGLGGMLGGLFGGSGRRDSPVQAMVKSAARSFGSQVGSAIIRGMLGSILKK